MNIKLRQVGDQEPLPRNVFVMTFGDKATFVKKDAFGRIFPLPTAEQERLFNEYKKD